MADASPVQREPANQKAASEEPQPLGAPHPGVLLSDEIARYVESHDLITEYRSENLQAASYDLRLGSDCYLGSEKRVIRLSDSDPFLHVPPQDVAVLSTEERLNIPPFLIGRWNIRIGLIYKGILLVSGPQVDPGYSGPLYTVVYNFATSEVILRKGEHIATIDFTTTTPYIKGKCKDFVQKRRTFADYVNFIESRPMMFTKEVDNRLAEFQAKVDRAERLVAESLAVSVATALAVAALVIAFVLSFRP